MSERPTDRHSHGQQLFGNSPITGGRSSRLALLRVAEAQRGGPMPLNVASDRRTSGARVKSIVGSVFAEKPVVGTCWYSGAFNIDCAVICLVS
jgi:hypothetical protein